VLVLLEKQFLIPFANVGTNKQPLERRLQRRASFHGKPAITLILRMKPSGQYDWD